MSCRYVYVDGRFVPWHEASVHAEDRGFQFGDAVYEVIEVRDGRLVDERRHMDRLDRSLKELRISEPMARTAWAVVLREAIRRNRVLDGSIYLQVSRGCNPRDFLFPPKGTAPTVVVLARQGSRAKVDAAAAQGIGVISLPDNRWGRCDIKTVMLLPASLAKEAAKASGAKEAWLVDEKGFVTEGGSSNAWIVDKEGRVITRKCDEALLRGITRTTLLDLLKREGIELIERPFTIDEAKSAREAFITSATNIVMPVVSIDGKPVGNGAPGMLTARLRERFHSAAEHSPV
jgi:D-alanine transaminase